MNNVKEALKILIKGENEAVRMYSAFSDQAKKEGYNNISLLFRALVMAEKIHIKNHYNALGEEFEANLEIMTSVSSTIENLERAITGEVEENKNLYPSLIKKIKKESKEEYGKVARLSMMAKDVEKEHARLLKMAYKSLKKGKEVEFHSISICQVCGNLVINKKPVNECDVCGHDAQFFKSITGEN